MRRLLLAGLATASLAGCGDGLDAAIPAGEVRGDGRAAVVELEGVKVGLLSLFVLDSAGAAIATSPKPFLPAIHLPTDRFELHGLPDRWHAVAARDAKGPVVLRRGAPLADAGAETRARAFSWMLGLYIALCGTLVVTSAFGGSAGNERLVPMNLLFLVSWLALAGSLERLWWWSGTVALLLMVAAPVFGMAGPWMFLLSRLVLVGGVAALAAILALHPGSRPRARWRGGDAIELLLRAGLRGAPVELRDASGGVVGSFSPFAGNARIVAFVPRDVVPRSVRVTPPDGEPFEIALKRRPAAE